MGSETSFLHILFFPLMALGHLIPMTDIARLFALRQGVQVSIVTTPLNATRIQSTIDRTTHLSGYHNITIHLLHLPISEFGLPEGCENLDSVTSLDMTVAFSKAINLLLHPFEELVECLRLDYIVSDMFFPWTIDVTEKFNIPRLVFYGTSYFSLCVSNNMQRYSLHESVSIETEPFLVPKLPHPIEITKSRMADFVKTRTPFTETMQKVYKADRRSYGGGPHRR